MSSLQIHYHPEQRVLQWRPLLEKNLKTNVWLQVNQMQEILLQIPTPSPTNPSKECQKEPLIQTSSAYYNSANHLYLWCLFLWNHPVLSKESKITDITKVNKDLLCFRIFRPEKLQRTPLDRFLLFFR